MKKLINEFIQNKSLKNGIDNYGIKKIIINEIFNKTKNAYSFNLYYDSETWKKIIELFYDMDFSEDAIIEIMLSKYMRWIADEVRGNLRELKNGDDNPPLITFDEFKTVLMDKFIDDIMDFVFETIGPDAHRMNEDMGGVSAPMSTPMNTPGVGNATLPQGNSNIGSGDNWNNEKPKKKRKVTLKKKKGVSEENINPHDKIGVAMAKKMKVPINFKKKGQGVKQKKIVKESIINNKNILSFEEWKKRI